MKLKPEQQWPWRWFGLDVFHRFSHRPDARQMARDPSSPTVKPVIAIGNTWFGFNPCHLRFKVLADRTKKCVLLVGGMRIKAAVLLLRETLVKPSRVLEYSLRPTGVYRLLHFQPLDGAILQGASDKTIRGLIMGALPTHIPSRFVPCAAMFRGDKRRKTSGSGSDIWKYWVERSAGNPCDSEGNKIEARIARAYGHCMTLAKACTGMAIAKILGINHPVASSITAVSTSRWRTATECGRQIVQTIWADLKSSVLLEAQSSDNALGPDVPTVGSTNAIVRIFAMDERAGAKIPLNDSTNSSG